MLKPQFIFISITLVSLFFILPGDIPVSASQPDPHPSSLFIENVGQFDPRARFLVQGDGLTLWIAEDGLWLTLPYRGQTSMQSYVPDPTAIASETPTGIAPLQGISVHLAFPGSDLTLEPFDRQDAVVSYFTPQGRFPDIPVWGGVRIGLSPGLFLEISGQSGHLYMNFTALSDTPREIFLQIEGPASLHLNNGLPLLSTPIGDIPLPIGGSPHLVIQANLNQSSISFSPILHQQSIISNLQSPATLTYATYLGGDADDSPNTLAVNDQGEIYVAGETYSAVFPSGPGLDVPTHLIAAFITKLDSTGTTLGYNINMVSAGLTENTIKDMVVDAAGNAYVAGYTDSADFPATPGAYDTVSPAASQLYKAFAMKINPTGGVVFATLLGTNTESELANGIAVNEDGNIYVTGYTQSASFPTTPGAYDTTLGGNRDVFVTQFNTTGTALVYSTFIGGVSKDSGERIALDASGNVVVSGYSEDGPTYPQTVAPIGPTGLWDIVVTKLNTSGTGLIFSTIVGGSCYDFFASGLAVDTAGNVFVSGQAYYLESLECIPDFPVTPGAYDTTLNGPVDAVLFKLNSNGSALEFSTYLGGSSTGITEFIYDLALDKNNHPYVVGYTDSADFPTAGLSYSTTLSGPVDIFVAKLNGTGTNLDYATFFGGTLEDYGAAIAVTAPYQFTVTGYTSSQNFPTTPGAFDNSYNPGGEYGFDGVIATFDIFGFLMERVYIPLVQR